MRTAAVKAAARVERSRRKEALKQRTPSWVNLESVQAKYDEAARLKKETGFQFHVDHKYPLRGKKVSGLHVAENLRVIKAEPNLKKGNR